MDRLVKSVQAGDKESMDELIRIYYDQIYCYIFKFTQEKETALDLTQDTFYKALNHIKLYKSKKGSFQSWLYTIAHNISMNYFKSKHYKLRNKEEEISELITADTSVEDEVIQYETSKKVSSAVIQLKSKYKDVVIMRFYQDFTINEIANQLNINKNTVKTRLRRGLNELKKILEGSDQFER